MEINEFDFDKNDIKNKNTKPFIRWQQITISQMGYTINLILGLAIASFGFSLNILFENKIIFSCFTKTLFICSLIFQIISIGFGLWVVINRLKDFRITTQIARLKDSEYTNSEAESKRQFSIKLGERTWCLFRIQLFSFGIGIFFSTIFFIGKLLF